MPFIWVFNQISATANLTITEHLMEKYALNLSSRQTSFEILLSV